MNFVLGTAVGLNALAYTVLDCSTPAPKVLDFDVLHARPLSAESHRSPAKLARIHQMVLGVVAERYPPALLVVGPVLDAREPPEHVEASRQVLIALGQQHHVPLSQYDTRRALLDQLGVPVRSLGRAVNRWLAEPLGSRDRRIVLATGAAVAGWRGGGAL